MTVLSETAPPPSTQQNGSRSDGASRFTAPDLTACHHATDGSGSDATAPPATIDFQLRDLVNPPNAPDLLDATGVITAESDPADAANYSWMPASGPPSQRSSPRAPWS